MMTVNTKDGSTYSLALQDFGSHGRVLAIARTAGPDDPPLTNRPMQQDRWYHVNVLDPLPAEVGTQLSMVLDPVIDDPDPIVRKTAMVTAVVGLIEPRTPLTPRTTATQAPAAVVVEAIEDQPPHRYAADSVAARSPLPFFNADHKAAKTSALFAGVTGLSLLFGRRHR